MSFKVTIEETRDVRKVIGKQWVKVGDVLKENPYGKEPYKSDVMDYAPEVETVRTETIKVYEQVVDTLDLKSVIAAINS